MSVHTNLPAAATTAATSTATARASCVGGTGSVQPGYGADGFTGGTGVDGPAKRVEARRALARARALRWRAHPIANAITEVPARQELHRKQSRHSACPAP